MSAEPPVRAPEPADGDERSILLGWLAFHRDALAAKCRGLTDEQLAERSAPPSSMSLVGLVRHLAEMERAYGAWALGPPTELTWHWGDYADGGEHDFDAAAGDVGVSMTAWRTEITVHDARLAEHPDLDWHGGANGRSVRWNLVKLIGEYARHNGHADLLRERIDGATGE